LDELCEIITWAQLKYHRKPCYVVNTDGFYDGLLQHFASINAKGFLSDEHYGLFKAVDSFQEALEDFSKQ
jgi:predicted Rossmann-fold nucleotide-binding protein